jgi:hypothetical protein
MDILIILFAFRLLFMISISYARTLLDYFSCFYFQWFAYARLTLLLFLRQTLQKERQARELAEKEKNELLERLNRLEEEATKARDGKFSCFYANIRYRQGKKSEKRRETRKYSNPIRSSQCSQEKQGYSLLII